MRRNDLDQARAVAILLILIGHSDGIPVSADRIIYSFHVPLFFIISGMLLHYTHIEARSWHLFFKSRFFRLIVPAFLWECILSVFYYIVKGIPAAQLIQNTLHLNFNLSVLWFIRCLFIAEFLCILLLKASHQLPILLIEMTVSVFLADCVDFPYMQQSFVACFFLLFGYCFDAFKQHLLKTHWIIVGSVLIWFFTMYLNSRPDLSACVLGQPALYYLHSTAGSLSVILFFLFLNKPLPLLNWVGQNSFGFLVTHVFVRFAFVQGCELLFGFQLRSWLLAFFLILFDSVIVWFIGSLFPEVFGKNRKKQERKNK